MTDPSPECPVRVGDLLAGKYEVQRVLGVGGMGVVLQARHVELDHTVALKLMLREMLTNPEAVGRFMREARAAARLQSDHIVRVLDVSRLESGEPFMVMELLHGRDLAEIVAAEGPQPVQVTADRIVQVCEALAEAHAAGIVHRDLKPANLFVAERPDGTQCVKVLDFGISKVQSSVDAGMTSTQSVLGSPAYMSPEQLRSAKNVDAATDVWALGAILFELLTGRRAYDGDTLAELVAKISVDPAPPLRPLRPDLPEALEALVLRCLEKEPRGRPRSVAELASGLEPFASKTSAGATSRIRKLLGLSAHAGGTAPLAAPSFGTDDTLRAQNTAATFGVTADSPRPSRYRHLVPLVVVIMIAGAVGVLAYRVVAGQADPATVAASAPSAELTVHAPSAEPVPEPAVSASVSALPSAHPPSAISAPPSVTKLSTPVRPPKPGPPPKPAAATAKPPKEESLDIDGDQRF